MPKAKSMSQRVLKPCFRIYCEGAKTEPNYIHGYQLEYAPGLRTIRIEPTEKNTALSLVNVAIKQKQSKHTPKGDIFWVIYDRESVIKYPNEKHQEAYEKAQAHGINIAITNVCFEVWLLLHLCNNCASYSNYDDLMKNSQFKKRLAELTGRDYHKAEVNLYSLLSSGVGEARQRAVRMNAQTISAAPSGLDKPYMLNPYTDMHKLLDAIDEFYRLR